MDLQTKNFIIEIATTDFITTRSAIEGGADRIELCADLSQGGTTQSFAVIKKCREAFNTPLFPIIRPRGGDFYYTDEEYEIMLTDIKVCKELGCDGVVVGSLRKDGTFPLKKLAMLVETAYPLEVTFHRAFDRAADPIKRLDELINLGVQRLLTSGQQLTAIDGVTLIKELVEHASDRIIIMPGSGIRKDNIKEIALKTGAVEFHSSLRSSIPSKMEYRHKAFRTDYTNNYIDPSDVSGLRDALNA